MKRTHKLISMVLALALSLSAMSMTAIAAAVQRFWDVPADHWAFEYIADLAERKVINGYDDGSFQPNRTVSRAEWAKMMVDAAGVQTGDNSVYFTDLSAQHWANKYVNAAKQYMTGYKDGTFRPNQAATREDVAVALVLLKGYNISDVDYSNLTFIDNDTISNYAKAYVAVAVQHNLIAGFTDGSFRGQDTLSRAQAAALLYRGFQHGSADKVIGGVNNQPLPTDPPQLSEEEEYQQQATPTIKPSPTPVVKDEENTDADNTASASVSTLVSNVEIDNVYMYTTDNRGNIYYVDDDYINVVSVSSGEVSEFQYIPDLDLETEEVALKDFQVACICWDISDNQLIIGGSYKYVNCADPSSVDNSFLIKSPGVEGSLSLVNPSFLDENHPLWEDNGNSRIVATTSDGKLITNFQLLNSTATEEVDKIVEGTSHWVIAPEYTKHAAHIGNNIYYVTADDTGADSREFCIYDFASPSVSFEFTGCAYGISKEALYIATDKAFERYNFSGKLLGGALFSDIKVLDNSPIKGNSIMEKLVIANGLIIFYDTSANAFRVLK